MHNVEYNLQKSKVHSQHILDCRVHDDTSCSLATTSMATTLYIVPLLAGESQLREGMQYMVPGKEQERS